jgi:hypothetical protein
VKRIEVEGVMDKKIWSYVEGGKLPGTHVLDLGGWMKMEGRICEGFQRHICEVS